MEPDLDMKRQTSTATATATAVDRIDKTMVARRTLFRFRHDTEVLNFVTNTYGQMTISECAQACRERFGERAPARSAIGRFWQWLDGQSLTGAA